MRQPDRGIAELLAQVRIRPGAGAISTIFLVAALQGAVALPHMARRFAVAGDLHLDVPRPTISCSA